MIEALLAWVWVYVVAWAMILAMAGVVAFVLARTTVDRLLVTGALVFVAVGLALSFWYVR